jgi:predicted transcriptional regulator
MTRKAREKSKAQRGKRPKNSRKGASSRTSAQRKVAFAVLHPTRLDCYVIFMERQATSPKEVASMLELDVVDVSHHVNELLADRVIRLVKKEQRRGAVEHYYAATSKPEVSDEEWRAMPKRSRRDFAATLLLAIIAESLSSLDHGKMQGDDDLYLLWIPARLTSKGQAEAYEVQAEAHDRLEDVIARDRERQAGSAERLSVRIYGMLGFERGRSGKPGGTSLGQRKALGAEE